ncbi:MAG: bifunctional demethylmenaquinone methyltransferase/2-methoxy-6-polyprenyl-1,4-benzoquinol methylase UbiE [Tannerellaceae bacterium]|jgi:demethylmenaquinone methyltransferase/2-methoxy-6-polyprenyl-1,4-benzoquinol methylase|nr:bifunctional demethylmenaquinone methyltransferase/2-methoxy-6-polyprenyl-1,4-benzoquinol methylase UbiE [Tannerellaceae bacterium]
MISGSGKILPYNTHEQKSVQIERMFDSIAETYDRLNHTLSFHIDKKWREKGIAFLKPFSPESILDVATGTGDLAIAMQRELNPRRIIGIDLSEGMMKRGRDKAAKAGYASCISFEQQDCLSLTYADNSFDAVTSAFGVRNFDPIEKGIAEMYRVLKPGGHLMILELSSPWRFPVKQLYTLYSQIIIPYTGRLLSKEKNAYYYLPESIKAVPQGRDMVDILRWQGLVDVGVRTFTSGICSLYTGKKDQ